ncbi:MAG: hypothetical protein GXP45_06215 [bacterium]|nr:hypothetical protein [bacterium]
MISNFKSKREHIPFFQELKEHPSFGPIFSSLNAQEQRAVEEIIKEVIKGDIATLKTK